jgi:biopolymer transport protein TolR
MAEINVTPLVDVMLVLLIIFMVTAPLDSQVQPVQVTLDGEGRIFVDQAPVGEASLARRFAAIAAEPAPAEGRRVYLRADRGLDYGKVMRVMGELNRAGLNRVALVSTSEGSR